MGAIKELFLQYQEEMGDDYIDDELQFQQWLDDKSNNEKYLEEQSLESFSMMEDLESINDSIKLKYSDWDITSVLHEVLGDANPDTDDILIRLNNLYNIKNGYID